jgi:hypothetical protein
VGEIFAYFCSGLQTDEMENVWVHCVRAHPEFETDLVETTDRRLYLICRRHSIKPAQHRSLPRPEKSEVIAWRRRPSATKRHGSRRLHSLRENETKKQSEAASVSPLDHVELPRLQYYHSATFCPMLESTWLLGMDSDDELDDSSWMIALSNAVRVCLRQFFCQCVASRV